MKDLRQDKRYGVQFGYLLDRIHSNDFDVEALDDKGKVNYVFETFEREFGTAYNKRMWPNDKGRLEQYLRGLPSCCAIAFSDYEILQIGESWGYCKNKRQEASFINGWFAQCAGRLIRMRDLLNK